MNYIKKFENFKIGDYDLIKMDIKDRLDELSGVEVIESVEYLHGDGYLLVYVLKDFKYIDIDDLVGNINWVVNYCSAEGYDVKFTLSSGNFDDIDRINVLEEDDYDVLLRNFINEKANNDSFINITITARKEKLYMVYIDDNLWGEFNSKLSNKEFQKEMELQLKGLSPLNMSDEGVKAYRDRYKNSKVTVKG